MTHRSALAPLLSLSLALFLAPAVATAQSAGGFSAGPGLAPAQPKEAPAPAAPAPAAKPESAEAADAGTPAEQDPGSGDYRTNIIAYKASPTFSQVREFTTTRLWVLDPGQFTVEQWWNGSFGAPNAQPGPNQGNQFFQTEIEMGVYKHVQLDIYANYQFGQNDNGNYQVENGGHTGIAAEVRIAIGSYWGEYWGNPTLYFELTSQYYNSPRAEARLLLGGTVLTPKLLAALNLCFERNIFRDPGSGIDYEIKADYGINYEVIPDIFRIGVEGVLGFDSHGIIEQIPGGVSIGAQRIFPVAEVGPSLVLMEPHKKFKILAAMLFGLADYDAPFQPTIIASTSF